MNLSHRTAALAGRSLAGTRLAAVQTEIAQSGIRLRFNDVDLETDYLADRASGCAALARGGLLISILLTLMFQVLDHFVLGARFQWETLQVLSLILGPLFLSAWIAMRAARCTPWVVHINVAALISAGLCFAWILPDMVVAPNQPPYASEALLLYVAVIYFLSGAMFRAASAIALTMSVLFMVAIAASAVTLSVVLYSLFFLVSFNLICAIGRYMLDKTYRRNFLTRMIAVELAERDPLTGIYNRRVFEDRLATLLRQSQRDNTSLTVLVLDIDHFKRINDSGGHGLGDTVLRDMANALRDIARRPLDSVARIGGDEFAALWMGLPAAEIDGRIADLVQRFAMRGENVMQLRGRATTISIGVAHAVDVAGHTTESLLHAADSALYRAKALGRARAEIEQVPALLFESQSAPQPSAGG